MSQYDIRQDKPYRRGLVLGMTMAEIMILLIFVLLMALASALSSREQQLKAIDEGSGTRLIEAMQQAYPEASTPDDYYKELVRSIEARKSIEKVGKGAAASELVKNADELSLIVELSTYETTVSTVERIIRLPVGFGMPYIQPITAISVSTRSNSVAINMTSTSSSLKELISSTQVNDVLNCHV